MKRVEFQSWVEHMIGAMPSYSGWLEKFPPVSSEATVPSQRGILDNAYRVLERTPLADARAAIDLIACGDEPAPRVFDDLPKSVRQISFKLRRNRGAFQHTQRRYDEPEAARCGWCDGGGIVYVLTPLCQYVLKQAWGKKVPGNWQAWWLESAEAANWRASLESVGKKGIEATRPCCCELGRPCDDSERFNPEVDCPFNATAPDDVVAWFANGPLEAEAQARRRREGFAAQRVPVPAFLWQPEAA